ncbi:MAG: hypothetical protein Tsb005_11000 [Gammaproteobacteria bacterium]
MLLKTGDKVINALYIPSARASRHGAIIIVPNDSDIKMQDITSSLHYPLHQDGWDLLVFPLPDNQTSTGRIKSAFDFLAEKKHQTVLLLGYGSGAQFILNVINKEKLPLLKGAIFISFMPQQLPLSKTQIQALTTFSYPSAFITAQHDYPKVLELIPTMRLIQRDNSLLQVWQLAGTDYRYQHFENILAQRLKNWLRAVKQFDVVNQKKIEMMKK